MAVTNLKRKLKRKRQAQNTRVLKIKQLNKKPVIKNVDVEELKKDFGKSGIPIIGKLIDKIKS